MINHNYSGSRNRSTNEERANWNQNDDQQRSDRDGDRDRDRDEDRWAGERNRRSYSDQDTGNFSRDREAMTERYGQGQSGYGAGRYGEDRSLGYQNRNQSYPSGGHGYDDRQPARSGMGLDDRFSGRGGGDWPERSTNYGSDRGREQDYRGSRRERGSGMGSGMGSMMDRPNDAGRYESGRSGSSGYGSDYSGYGEARHGGYGYRRGMAGDRGMTGDRSTDYDRGMGMDYDRSVGGHRGKGPKDWQRSDERIRESVSEALADHDHIDATHIQVAVKDGEVTLSGTVEDRRMKRLAEDCVEQVSGVKEVQNNIRVQGNEGRMTGAIGNGRTGTSDKSSTTSDKKTHS